MACQQDETNFATDLAITVAPIAHILNQILSKTNAKCSATTTKIFT